MVVINLVKFGIPYEEVWFYSGQGLQLKRFRLVRCVQSEVNSIKYMLNKRTFITTEIDLNEDLEVIFQNFSKKLRYDLRNASNKSYEVTMHCNLSSQLINEIRQKFQNFASRKKLKNLNYKRLQALSEQQSLVVSKCVGNLNGVETYHIYMKSNSTVRLLHSFDWHLTAESSLGVQNKYHHWTDIQSFHRGDYSIYDFGGISGVKSVNSIDRFKGQFGGNIKKYETGWCLEW